MVNALQRRKGSTVDQTPLPLDRALWALAGSIRASAVLLTRGVVHLPHRHLGKELTFADGTSARIYRETVVNVASVDDPCVLVVEFRLHGVHGRGHALFRAESLLNTPLFVGFPGFVSKLWLAHDGHGVYRGLYEWDGPQRAESYARALWWVLALVSAQLWSPPGRVDAGQSTGRQRGDVHDRRRQPRRRCARRGHRPAAVALASNR